jgi:hypothetical protein
MTAWRSRHWFFATFAGSTEQLQHVYLLAESIRQFAGQFREAPIRVYLPQGFDTTASEVLPKLVSLQVEIRKSSAPQESRWLYYAEKVFAAAVAERDAEGFSAVLVWLDEDTIVLQEPAELVLPENVVFGYRPVMHNRSGSLYTDPPDSYWSRVYDRLAIDVASLFSMITPADRQTIRAYFNAGLLVVRPERHILRRWAEDFTRLYADRSLIDMCEKDITRRIFLHQTALVGVVNHVSRDEMIELPETYNYPLFFHEQWEAADEFGSIENVVTLRYDTYFRDPDPDWRNQLRGPDHLVAWLSERLGSD